MVEGLFFLFFCFSVFLFFCFLFFCFYVFMFLCCPFLFRFLTSLPFSTHTPPNTHTHTHKHTNTQKKIKTLSSRPQTNTKILSPTPSHSFFRRLSRAPSPKITTKKRGGQGRGGGRGGGERGICLGM